jgi:hypothetical protein
MGGSRATTRVRAHANRREELGTLATHTITVFGVPHSLPQKEERSLMKVSGALLRRNRTATDIHLATDAQEYVPAVNQER